MFPGEGIIHQDLAHSNAAFMCHCKVHKKSAAAEPHDLKTRNFVFPLQSFVYDGCLGTPPRSQYIHVQPTGIMHPVLHT
jgi:hypothetical protein